MGPRRRPRGHAAPASANLPDGKLDVFGAELRLDANMYGYFYAGFSQINADDAVTVAPAIEVLHAYGGGQFNLGVTDNYLDTRVVLRAISGRSRAAHFCSGGNGAVNSILAQYEFSVANLLTNLESPGTRFWGEGRDFSIALYGMYNKVESENKCDLAADPTCNRATDMDGVSKLKFGTDLAFSALSWFGVGTRFDRVQPNSRIPEQSFSVLSPRLIFRSKWVTHEEIQLQYSRYMYNQRTCEVFNIGGDRHRQSPGWRDSCRRRLRSRRRTLRAAADFSGASGRLRLYVAERRSRRARPTAPTSTCSRFKRACGGDRLSRQSTKPEAQQ